MRTKQRFSISNYGSVMDASRNGKQAVLNTQTNKVLQNEEHEDHANLVEVMAESANFTAEATSSGKVAKTVNPLEILKLRYINDEITEVEYRKKLKLLS